MEPRQRRMWPRYFTPSLEDDERDAEQRKAGQVISVNNWVLRYTFQRLKGENWIVVLIAPRGGLLPLALHFLFTKTGHVLFFNWSTRCDSESFFRRSVETFVFILYFIVLKCLMAVFREASSQGLLQK